MLPFFKRHKIEKFIGWARENALMLDFPEAMNAGAESLSFLDGLLEKKRVVYLGEEDHWIHEKNEYRILLLRYLVSRGWRFIGEELGWSDGTRIDRFIGTGKPSELERIATYGYRGDERGDRKDSATGLLKDSSDHYPLQEFKAEQLRFAQALRNINEGLDQYEKLHYFGFDVNAAAGGGCRDIEDLLGSREHAAEIAELKKMLAIIPGESIEEEIQRLNRVLEFVQLKIYRLKELLGEKNYQQLRQNILTIRDSFSYFRIANPAVDYKTLNKAMAARELGFSHNLTL